MGTFHDGRGELHGITVLVETTGTSTWVGRCDTVADGRIVLFEAESHEGGQGPTREQWLRRVAMAGFFPQHARVVLPLDDVVSVKRLSEVA